MAHSLDILERQNMGTNLERPLHTICQSIDMGLSLSQAFNKERKLFGSMYISLLQAAETHGHLDQTLEQLAQYAERDCALRERVRGALMYPAFVLAITILLTWAMMVFALPSFLGMFSQMKEALPLPTRILVFMVSFLRNPFTVFLSLCALYAAFHFLRQMLKTTAGREVFDTFILRLPVAGVLARKMCLARLSRSLGTLLRSGVIALDALVHSANVCGNTVYQLDLMQARERLKEGMSISEYFMADRSLYPALFAQMVAAGEHSGKLEEMMVRAAETYELDVEYQLQVLLTLLEPLLMALLALIVGFIVISLFLPIYGFLTKLL